MFINHYRIPRSKNLKTLVLVFFHCFFWGVFFLIIEVCFLHFSCINALKSILSLDPLIENDNVISCVSISSFVSNSCNRTMRTSFYLFIF